MPKTRRRRRRRARKRKLSYERIFVARPKEVKKQPAAELIEKKPSVKDFSDINSLKTDDGFSQGELSDNTFSPS